MPLHLQVLLPAAIKLEDWIERRIGEEVSFWSFFLQLLAVLVLFFLFFFFLSFKFFLFLCFSFVFLLLVWWFLVLLQGWKQFGSNMKHVLKSDRCLPFSLPCDSFF